MRILKKIFQKKLKISGKGNQIIIEKNNKIYVNKKRLIPKGIKIFIKGDNNQIKLKLPIVFSKSEIIIEKSNNTSIYIGNSVNLSSLSIRCKYGENQKVIIGDGTTCYGVIINITERSSFVCGKDCMFSNSISIWCADGHSVIDNKDSKILNWADGVVIGNHVWVGEGAKITKRAKIYDNSIVAIASVAYKDYKESGVVIGGNPGEIIKRGISWNRLNPLSLTRNSK